MKNMLFFGGILAVLYLIHKTANQEKTVTVVDKDKYGMPRVQEETDPQKIEDMKVSMEILQKQTFKQTV